MSTIPQVKITIDGQALEVPQGVMIIEAADNNNITIPRFCYHKKLTVAANCRMCLVEVEKSKKPLPACATPVADGMIIQTKSPKALAYQKAVMEFLLINHPLDCPICDQGGECELQDLSMGYGKDVSRYNQGKRSVADKDIGPLVETDLTRCIQCTRCVRFGAEIAGLRELGMIHRGEHEEIATFVGQAVTSELSGNIIDLCPVGALTNKPFRYQARAWELTQQPAIAPHDCVGSNMYLHVRRGEAMRSVPKENETLNEVWLSDRDRYSVHAFNVDHRATQPMIKSKGKWSEVDWITALEVVAKKLKATQKKSPEKIAALSTSQSTVEEFYLLQKLTRSLGSNNIDFRGRVNDFSYQNDTGSFPGIDCKLSDINNADTILVIGSLPRKEAPLFHHRLRQAAGNGAKVFFINPIAAEHNFEISGEIITDYSGIAQSLVKIAKAITKEKPLSAYTQGHLDRLEVADKLTATEKAIIAALLNSEKPMIFTGALAMGYVRSSEIFGLAIAIKEVLAAQGGVITPGANVTGGYLAGALPHRGPAGGDLIERGKTIKDLLDPQAEISVYLLLNTEPYYDTLYGASVNKALKQADMVVAITPFVTDYLKEHADVILPMNLYAENSGTFINVMGEWQSWQGAAKPKGEARPAWKILRVLANILALPGFDYIESSDVIQELKAHIANAKPLKTNVRLPEKITMTQGLQRLGPVMMYATDMLVRQSMPLQKTTEAKSHNFVGVAPDVAAKEGWVEGDMMTLSQDDNEYHLPLKLIPIAASMVYVAQMPGFETLGNSFAPITIKKKEK